ncbi:hypothetical protein Y032_0077g1118 [Ancylostoma ceylanicum]|uniref:Endonuclease III homolog n=1 Tax=Ancylostoma ceylanicum TaxID=53326 RepID=A0A016TU43_9BILA|nr:hypothetical protein Y032_0077g1118 [Ancylostoma ceylanicum]
MQQPYLPSHSLGSPFLLAYDKQEARARDEKCILHCIILDYIKGDSQSFRSPHKYFVAHSVPIMHNNPTPQCCFDRNCIRSSFKTNRLWTSLYFHRYTIFLLTVRLFFRHIRMKRTRKGRKPDAAVKKVCDIEDLWKLQLEKITEMRKSGDAPVDTMGCHKLADPLATPETFRFQVLLALMLSSQTKDEVTSAAMMRLRNYGCNVDAMLKIPTSELEKLLCPVGFYRRKAEYIQKAAAILKEKYNGDVPDSLEGLCSLPGVGPKMAHLVLQIAYDKVDGIAVDTHVHRIVNRLGWMKTDTPEKTRAKLQELLPRSYWTTINPLLVGFGQQTCLPVKPKCGICLCQEICPSSTAKPSKKSSGETN